MTKRTEGEFSTVWFGGDGRYVYDVRWVDAENALLAARRLTHGPASALGIVQRVIVTDGGDCVAFEWKRGEGITFPPELAGRAK